MNIVSTQEAFAVLMEAIDRELRERKVPIHLRPTEAVGKICRLS
jgi:hypothetical protein